MDRDVYVIGVGIHRFGKHDVSRRDMAYVAGIDALEDAGISFKQVGSLYTGYIGGNMLDGVTYAKDLGLTGIPVVHVENASATGSSAFRQAVNDVSGAPLQFTSDTASFAGFPSFAGVSMHIASTRPSVLVTGRTSRDARPGRKSSTRRARRWPLIPVGR